jgi:hypothetical protein
MRLFPDLAFYITMVIETMKDISYFVIIFMTSIMLFANAYFALRGIPMPEESEGLWMKTFGSNFGDSMMSQYMLGLGEFVYDGWSDHEASSLIWFYFILATFFT